MSWLSQGLSDIGLNSVNTAFNSQPSWLKDVEGGAAAGLATFGIADLAAPAVFGADALAGGLGTAAPAGEGAAAGAPLDLAAVAAGGGGTAGIDAGASALGFAGDVTGDTIPGFPTLASDSALAGNITPVGGLPAAGPAATNLGAAATAAAPDASGGALSSLDPSSLDFLENAGVNPDIATQALNAGGSAGSPGVLSTIGSGLKTAAPFVGAAGLGYSLYGGYEQKQALNQLNQQEAGAAASAQAIAAQETNAAQPLITQGTALTQYLTTNTLPPQYQSMVAQQVAAQKAAIIQGYASRGQNSNPEQNSALQQDLNNVDTQASTLQANLEQQLAQAGTQMVTTANQLLQSGASATQISAELPIQIAQLNASLNATTSTAISNFAAAMNGGANKNSVTLNIPQNVIQ